MKWVATIEVVVEAETRSAAWAKAGKIALSHDGEVRSVPQKPEED